MRERARVDLWRLHGLRLWKKAEVLVARSLGLDDVEDNG